MRILISKEDQVGLFSKRQMDDIISTAKKSKAPTYVKKPKARGKGITAEIQRISDEVLAYFKDSKARLITTQEELHDYITRMIEAGIGSIDTETTGLDRVNDTIVGFSLYYPGDVEVYIPCNHIIPIFEEPYSNQITYEQAQAELQRLVDARTKLVFANADFDLGMIYKDIHVDLLVCFFYDVILAWRCIKEDERDNALKVLYNKYVLRGHGDPKKFSDFFSPTLFPYCKPEVAKLYAANDAKITYELFVWQLPYVTKDNAKCKKKHLEAISDLIWNVEFPMVTVAQRMHRRGMYIEKEVANMLRRKYHRLLDEAKQKLYGLVQECLDDTRYHARTKRPFSSASDFNPNSTPHVKWLCYDLLGLDAGKKGETGKEILGAFGLPVTDQILYVRSLVTLIGTFVDKMPDTVASDEKLHCTFKIVGADTGRMSSADPNLQNVPSKQADIRHMFRAMPGNVLMSSDYSQQEPKLTAYISQDENMIKSFQENKDIYSFIAAIAFNKTYDECLEFTPDRVYNPEGKARRTEAKSVVLGILYGRSTVTIADQLYSHEPWSQDKKIKQAQFVYDSVLAAFPALKKLMENSQAFVRKYGYTETILGRRRHIPDMQLPEYEFSAQSGYINPDIDPLDISTLSGTNDIPKRIRDALYKELTSYKYFGQVARRIRELDAEGIKVTNNRYKIQEATRQVVNSIIQGSAADTTKMALLNVENDEELKELGGRIVNVIHDEILLECPIENKDRCAEILAQRMCEAAGFLPFPIKCDVEITLHWYGLPFPCEYQAPTDLDDVSEESIKWLQWHMYESGYDLPVYKNPDGSKPEGVAAKGVNGKWSNELEIAIKDYKTKHDIDTDAEFIEYIHSFVYSGIQPKPKSH